MGIDLRLYPQRYKEIQFSLDVLSLERDEKLFELIRPNLQKIRPYGFSFYNDDGYKLHKEDSYGDKLQGIYVDDLKNILNNYNHESSTNKAITAFINELPDDVLVCAYWC